MANNRLILSSLFMFVVVAMFCGCKKTQYIDEQNILKSDSLYLGNESINDEFWHYRLDTEGRPVYTPIDLLKLIGGDLKLCEVDWDDEIIWKNLGPFESRNSRQMNQGRIESISVNKYDDLDIVIGSHNGGSWRTTNGGENWHNTTDDEGFSVVGFHEMVRHPKNQQIIYAATGTALDKWNNGQRGYGIGIVMSEDGGETWDVTGYNPPYGGWLSGTFDIEMDPRSTLDSTILYTINATSLFRWTGSHKAEGKWDVIYENRKYYSGPAIYGNVGNHDIELDRYGNVYLCNGLGVYFHKAGSSEVNKIERIEIPEKRKTKIFCNADSIQNPVKVLYDLEINKQGHISLLANYYYVYSAKGKCKVKNKPYYYYVSKDAGNTWTDPVNLRTSGYAVPNLAVHQYNSDIFYFEGSGRHVRRSIDRGRTNTKLRTYRNHVDVRNLSLEKSKYGDTLGRHDIVYVGNDGGIAKLVNGDSWVDISGDGIANTNYFGLGITEEDNEFVFLGAQDGSANFYKAGEWYTTSPGGDNGDCLIDPRDKYKVHQSANGAFHTGKVTRKQWRGKRTKSFLKGVGLFPMLMNPSNPNEVFAGGLALFHSADNGMTWSKMERPHPPIRINKMAMSKSNPDVLYYVVNGFFWDKKSKADSNKNTGGIYKAVRNDDGDWRIEDITSNLKLKCVGENNCGLPQLLSSVTVDPKNADRLWVTMSGFEAGKKVFYSSDGGKSWENKSNCLPNLPAICIVYDAESEDGLYVGTDYGVFYTDANLSEWIYYGELGPKCMVTDMEINNASGELYISTMGRGLWKAPLIER